MTDFTGHPEDRELYYRLLAERDGLALRSLGLPRNREPDPEVARRRAELEAIPARRQRRTQPVTEEQTAEHRTPPVPGAEWCKSCGSWCMPSGICGCNNR
ncbi:hypothetical protein ACFVIM_00730 [Streptomyces sp. NPDC057638]|uniref:hypothetical protein n=1 Tax=Streptomyces sp. NPDC057638 TaxID=3346190 RepID=UPI00367E7D38